MIHAVKNDDNCQILEGQAEIHLYQLFQYIIIDAPKCDDNIQMLEHQTEIGE